MKNMKLLLFALTVVLSGCAGGPPGWKGDVTPAREAEYEPYLAHGTGSVEGQAYLNMGRGPKGIDGIHTAAGSAVTLDPATKIGRIWWVNALLPGKYWPNPAPTPPSSGFAKARRTTIADADGRFKFSGLAAGEYFVSTIIVWESQEKWTKGQYGGVFGKEIKIRDGETNTVTLNKRTWEMQ